MSKLQLELNVKTQEQLINAFAKALESVANSSEQAETKTDDLSKSIGKLPSKATMAAFSFNQWSTALSTVSSLVSKVSSYIKDLSDKIHDNETRVMRYQSRWGENGFKEFTRIKQRFVDMGLGADEAADALDNLSAKQKNSKQAEGLGIAAINTGKLLGLSSDKLKTFVSQFADLIDIQGQFRPDKLSNIISTLDPVDADKLLKTMGTSLQQYRLYGTQALPTWEKFSNAIIKTTTGTAKAVATMDPKVKLDQMNNALEQFKLKIGEALLLPAPGESLSAIEKITQAVIKFVEDGENIKNITELFQTMSKAIPIAIDIMKPTLEWLKDTLKWISDHKELTTIIVSTIAGGMVGGIPGAIVGAFAGTTGMLAKSAADSDKAKADYEAQKEAKEKTLREIAKLQVNLDQTQARTQALEMGQAWSTGYANGIRNGTDEVKKAVEDLVGVAKNTTAATQDSHSPSRVAKKQGGYYGQGYAGGINDSVSQVEEAARSMTSAAISTTNTTNNVSNNTSNVTHTPSLNITISGNTNDNSNLVNTLNSWWETINARQAVSGL